MYPYLGLGVNSLSVPGYSLIDTILGMHYSFLDNFSLFYMYGTNADYGIDELDVQTGTILTRSQDEKIRSAYYDGGTYRSIVSATFFGAMVDGIYTKADVMEQYLIFLSGVQEPNIWTESNQLEFELQFAGYPLTQPLVIYNTGADTLMISNITVSGEVFYYSGPTVLSIQPSSQEEILIGMNALITGYHQGEMVIFSNDPDTPEYEISLGGYCVQPPVITIDPLLFEISLEQNQTGAEVLTIQNTGGYDLFFAISVEESGDEVSWLEIYPDSGSIAPAAGEEVTIILNTENLDPGFYQANLIIAHNDPAEDELVLPVSLNVIPTEVSDEIMPNQPLLKKNYPNPFNPQTTIAFSTTNAAERTTLTVYNTKGQVITTLISAVLPAGEHQIVWDGIDDEGRKVSSGVYLYRMRSGDYSSTRKMLMMK